MKIIRWKEDGGELMQGGLFGVPNNEVEDRQHPRGDQTHAEQRRGTIITCAHGKEEI